MGAGETMTQHGPAGTPIAPRTEIRKRWAVAVAAAILCGCGGGSGGTSAPPAPPPPAGADPSPPPPTNVDPPPASLSTGPAPCADGRAGDFACDGISLLSRVPLDELDEIDFEGAWSVYPYLPSGTILVSDMQHGLFVVSLQ